MEGLYLSVVTIRGPRQRLDALCLELETDYTSALVAVLRITASGKCGLFGHNGDRWTRSTVRPVIDNLDEIGQAINKAKDQVDMSPFELQQQFHESRAPVGPQTVGEPK